MGIDFAQHKWVKVAVFGLLLCAMVLGFSVAPAMPVLAAPNPDQAIELDNGAFNVNKPTFKLVPLGLTIGCKKGTNNLDYKFSIDFGTRFPGPFNPDQFRLKTWNSKVEQSIRETGNSTIWGYNLTSRTGAYVCIGLRTVNAGGSPQTISIFENR